MENLVGRFHDPKTPAIRHAREWNDFVVYMRRTLPPQELADFVVKWSPLYTTQHEDIEKFNKAVEQGDKYACEVYSRWLLKL